MANATPDIDDAFIEEFERGVHMAYQREGSLIRGTVRTKNGVKNKTTFQKVGKGSATQKSRHGEIPPMNVSHDNVNVTVEDYFAGEWIDEFDTLRINHDEKMVAMQSGAWALGRKTDDLLIDAMGTTTSAHDETTNGITKTWALELMENFGNNDVPVQDRYCVIGWEQWSQLMAIDEFSNRDYVGDRQPFLNAIGAKNWLSFTWYPHSGLDSVNSDADRECFAYQKNSVGHAIGDDVKLRATQYYGDRDSWWILNKMQMQAVLIDAQGCFECQLKK